MARNNEADNLLVDGNFDQVDLRSGAPGVTTDLLRGNYTQTAPTGWSGTGGVGTFAPTAAASPAFDNAHVAYIAPNGKLSQTASSVGLVPNTDLLISLDIGTRTDIPPSSGIVTISVNVGSKVIGQTTFNAASEAPGAQQAVSFTTQAVPATTIANGHRAPNFTLSISNGANSQILVDNVVAQRAVAAFDVGNEAQLNSAIEAIDVSGAQSGAGLAYFINITGPISLTSPLEALNLAAGASLTVAGTSSSAQAPCVQTIDGAGSQRGFFVYSGNVTFENLNIQNTLAQGGSGGAGGFGGGGGGAGLGGGLFLAGGSNVTLKNITFVNNAAKGGNGGAQANASSAGWTVGGGGGMGQNGLTGILSNTFSSPFEDFAGAGGGIGAGSAAGIVQGAAGGGSADHSGNAWIPSASGVLPGSAAGGAGETGLYAGGGGGVGGGNAGTSDGGPGGNGGFGGGGGGSMFQAGNGGFGGGGGASAYNYSGNGGFGGGGGGGIGDLGTLAAALPGAGGFGGGNGGAVDGGGGGLGAGGAVFVMQGATLSITGGTLANGTVAAGVGAQQGGSGKAYGAGIFIQGNQSITFGTGQRVSQTTAINGNIADETGSSGQPGAGAGQVIIDGYGTVVLGGNNTYTGGTDIKSGQLTLANPNAGGSGAITFSPSATLQIDGTAMPSNILAGFTPGDIIDLPSIGYDAAAQVHLDKTSNILTISGHGKTYELHFNPSQNFGGDSFYLESDTTGGAKLILLPPPIPPGDRVQEPASSSGGANADAVAADAGANSPLLGTIAPGTTLEIPSASSESVVFSGSTGQLILDDSVGFTGTVSGLGGQDAIDFKDISYNGLSAASYSGDTSGGTLSVSDIMHTARISLSGGYAASSFVTSSDGHGGTDVTLFSGGWGHMAAPVA